MSVAKEKGFSESLMNVLSHKGATLMTLLILVVATILVWGESYGIGAVIKASGGVGVLDVSGPFNVEKAHQHLTSLGDAGREAYKAFLLGIDLIYPATYALFGLCLLACLYRPMIQDSHRWKYVLALPVLAAAADYFENLMFLWLLAEFPLENITVAEMANIFHLSKPLLGLCAMGFALWGYYRRWRFSDIGNIKKQFVS